MSTDLESSPSSVPSVRKARRHNSTRTDTTEDMFSTDDDLSSISGSGDFPAGHAAVSDDELSVDPNDVLMKVDRYLADYDGPAEDSELLKLQDELRKQQVLLEELDQELENNNDERRKDIEEADQNVRRMRRSLKERSASIEDSKYGSAEAEERRQLVARKSDEDMLKAMQSMQVYNELFEEQKKKIRKKTAKRDKLAVEMKLGARKALRRLKLVDVRARIEAENEAKQKKAKGPELDMSENARRERVYQWYTRTAMPNKKLLTDKIAKLPPDAGLSVADVDLLPWDDTGKRVNLGEINKLLFGRKR